MATTLNLQQTGQFLSRFSLTLHALGKDSDSIGDRFLEDANNSGISNSTYNTLIDQFNGLADEWAAGTLTLTDSGNSQFTPPIGGMPSRPRPIHK